mmetsp:Transcript_127528/g.190066  ORF Transcript_127528/g.190066 Transcript_127528/m.190066 type:complete len:99 (+) Transcript_127528:3-299(+)
MLFALVPANMLSTTSDAYGGLLTGDTGMGFDIVDSYHAPLGNPSYSNTTHIDTAYGGGFGTSDFAGGMTPIASGVSPASYGVPPPYYDSIGGQYGSGF